MKKNLPARPNLDHLRRQAKALLSALESQDADAASTILNHLPAAKEMTLAQVLGTRYRLADAQSAIARKTGFASWPHLARHVEQLRALEGTWTFARLEIDGSVMPAGALAASRILIDGDRFRTESPEANCALILSRRMLASLSDRFLTPVGCPSVYTISSRALIMAGAEACPR